jgi:hypothetical protein
VKVNKITAVIAPWLITFSLTAIAQQPATVGDLLDKGGVRLGAAEVKQVLNGATVTGLQASNNLPFKLTHKEGGNAEGHGSTTAMYVSGTWSINNEGQVCTNLRSNSGTRLGTCSYYFKLDNSYFIAPSDEKVSSLLARDIKR